MKEHFKSLIRGTSAFQHLKNHVMGDIVQWPAVEVDVVLLNWRRPKNFHRLIPAFRNQTVPCRIIVVQCSDHGHLLPNKLIKEVDHVITTNKNFGAPNRLLSLFELNSTYTYFHDDDILPGSRLLEHYINAANQVSQFSLLGQHGRIFSDLTYVKEPATPHPTEFTKVDSIVQSYFIKTQSLKHLLDFKDEMLAFSNIQFPFRHDDLFMCLGLQKQLQYPCYITPFSSQTDIEESICKEQLPEPYGLQGHSDHVQTRIDFIKAAHQAGWRSFVS